MIQASIDKAIVGATGAVPVAMAVADTATDVMTKVNVYLQAGLYLVGIVSGIVSLVYALRKRK